MLVETTFHLIAVNRVADVSVWTRQMGISPSGKAQRGDITGKVPSPDSWWALVREKRESAGVERELQELLRELLPHKHEITALAASENLEVTVTSYVWGAHGQGLVADLSPAMLRSLSELGCSYSVVAYESP
ncbi:DUF4279 domain-containing protein [Acidovorax sp. GW101-3H11]|uniref:DUF4279 domain-containing protein n=1 Tax=Acidovorax sp. GW101-3H11 TaxID=1813946 RepID=UPI0009ED4361|nr:DUF4279 domain-containing protein [Acidovorax sp. GW101-3H11]